MSEDKRLENIERLLQNVIEEVKSLTEAFTTSQFKPASDIVPTTRPTTPSPIQIKTSARWSLFSVSDQDLMNNILSLKPSLSTDALIDLVEQERAKAQGLLTVEAAIYLVASNLGLDAPTEIVEFIEGKYVDVEGTVQSTPEYKTGDRQDGTEWKMSKFDFEVQAEMVSVALWDDFALEGLKFSKGDRVLFKGIKVNKPYEGKTQLGSARYTELEKLD